MAKERHLHLEANSHGSGVADTDGAADAAALAWFDKADLQATLNRLLEVSRDCEYGFSTAAGYTDSPHLQALLMRRAADCHADAQEQQAMLVALGAPVSESGSAAGALHRGWVSLRGSLAHYSDEAMLAECQRGEDAALASYLLALKHYLPPQVRSMVARQAQHAQRCHDEVHAMCASLRPQPPRYFDEML